MHRLGKVGAVVSHVAHGISQEGFDAEWRDIHVLGVESEMLSRSELFDEADLDAAIARFEELHPGRAAAGEHGKPGQLALPCVRWGARTGTLSLRFWLTSHYSDDRRRVTGAGTRRGRDADIENMRVVTDLGANITTDVIATRGDRLALTRTRFSFDQQQQAFLLESTQPRRDRPSTAVSRRSLPSTSTISRQPLKNSTPATWPRGRRPCAQWSARRSRLHRDSTKKERARS